jgi:rubrerythrin
MSERRFKTSAEILAFAIEREIAAADGYARIAAVAETPGLRELAEELRGQEIEHRRILEGLTPGALDDPSGPSRVPDLHLVDALADEPLSGDMSLQDMLIFAAKKEAQSVALYESLARLAGPAGQGRIFLFLAGQEREHKLRIEAAYEAHVIPEN